ncbi:NAD kinase [Apilactobacillus kunkeei]|uniref:NAD kinase n=3 Tax=Apilactobacillus TaxID=2767877 RepID=A0A087EPC4_9LACO|nr:MULTISPECIES: NAD kinase [Apilactobacillus]ALJ31679.1 NAD kinase [Apilactobacillus kunkeei]KFJ15125.1 inorganic polyphosphate kinase [Apilactobacillus kunkeei]KOY71447.1 NAD kinase [Apilactobacillus kunkeei]KOY74616.1 NAD kinase [Apilactobacillus kunkeei]KOY76415.1 NAD kinase [Apilactobacillus kunkeei]
MKVAIYSNDGFTSKEVATQLKEKIDASEKLEYDGLNPQIVISVGGDGTLLSAFHHYRDAISKIRFVGIHTGHLGFYTDWRDYEVKELVDSLEDDNGQSVSYPLLSIKVQYTDGGPDDSFVALNESTLKRINGTMVTDIYIKDEFFEKFRGDGLCVSTPTGSTAYNKSVGGAIINPQLNAIQVSEMASINNRVFRTLGSPVIVPPDETITIVPDSPKHNILTCDQLLISDRPIKSISYSICNDRIYFAQYRHTHFWKRVSNSFIGVHEDD